MMWEAAYIVAQVAYFAFGAWLVWTVRDHPFVALCLAASVAFAYLFPA